MKIRYQPTFDVLVDGHLRFLTRDPRYARKRKHRLTLGFAFAFALGLALPVEPWLRGLVMALGAACALAWTDYWAPRKTRENVALILKVRGVRAKEEFSYSLEAEGLRFAKGNVEAEWHEWSTLKEIEMGTDYLALLFQDAFTYLPLVAFEGGSEQMLAWSQKVLEYRPDVKRFKPIRN